MTGAAPGQGHLEPILESQLLCWRPGNLSGCRLGGRSTGQAKAGLPRCPSGPDTRTAAPLHGWNWATAQCRTHSARAIGTTTAQRPVAHQMRKYARIRPQAKEDAPGRPRQPHPKRCCGVRGKRGDGGGLPRGCGCYRLEKRPVEGSSRCPIRPLAANRRSSLNWGALFRRQPPGFRAGLWIP